jgi:hypothetical protein
MTDKPVHGESKTSMPDSAEEDASAAESSNIGVLIKADGSISIDHSAIGAEAQVVVTPETVAIVTAVAIFSKAFLETLGHRTGEGVANLSKRVGDLVRARIKGRGEPDKYLIGLDGGATAIVVVTDDTPDEARLALLDLDVTAPDLRGKYLSWSRGAAAWLPTEALPAKSDEAAP